METVGTARHVVAVVLNWCGEDDTVACLESLAASRYDNLTLLLIDNASPDGSGNRLHERFPSIPYVQTGSNLGYAGGNNVGIRWAATHGADYVLILNNDATVEPNCIRLLVETAERQPDAAVIAPKILYMDARDRVWFGGGSFSRFRGLGVHRHELARDGDVRDPEVEPITFFTGCCFLARTEVLSNAGGFDESFFAYIEDAELSLRLSKSGHALLYAPPARAYHRVAPTRRTLTPFHIRQRDRNRRRLVARHYPIADRVMFAAWFYPTRFLHALRFLATGDLACFRAQLDGAFGPLDRVAHARMK